MTSKDKKNNKRCAKTKPPMKKETITKIEIKERQKSDYCIPLIGGRHKEQLIGDAVFIIRK